MFSDLVNWLILSLLVASAILHGEDFLPILLVMLLFTLALFVREKNEQQRQRFINQLKSQKNLLLGGSTIQIDSMIIRNSTVLGTYKMTLGAGFASVTIKSNYSIFSQSNSSQGLYYSALTIISGWFSFPFGPMFTLECLKNNFRGGEKSSVWEIISPRSAPKKLPKASKGVKAEAWIDTQANPSIKYLKKLRNLFFIPEYSRKKT